MLGAQPQDEDPSTPDPAFEDYMARKQPIMVDTAGLEKRMFMLAPAGILAPLGNYFLHSMIIFWFSGYSCLWTNYFMKIIGDVCYAYRDSLNIILLVTRFLSSAE
ncbi:hypothetical protein ACJX0J_005661, partial [Zea mays]